MKRFNFGLAATAVALFAISGAAVAGDSDEIGDLLQHFLAHADEAAAHERFWSDDLVYTSSRGTRTNKQEIMASFDDPNGAAERAASPGYHGEDVDIRLYGDMAVIAFRLVGTAADGTVQQYFNTGTFLKRDGTWRAIAWQATKIP
jgi:hypothetical protein